jgi:uncharacterized protein YndB with AHSA1/START domain
VKINREAPLVARKDIYIEAMPEVVWRTHADIDNWHRWHPGIAMARLEGPLATGTIFRWKSGGLAITSTIRTVVPGEEIGWTGRALGTRARHLWQLEEHSGGTMLTTEESMEGWLVGVLKLVMPTFLESSLDTWLQSLKQEAEAAQSAEVA